MGKYIKLFENHSNYEAYASSEKYIEPHVSYCEEDGCVQYNKKGTRTITIHNFAFLHHYIVDDVEYSISQDETQTREITDSIVLLDRDTIVHWMAEDDETYIPVQTPPVTVLIPDGINEIDLYDGGL
ncbi:MAG: hypothetical protein MJZ16_08835 [Bacteroidales bacterium]|nr:hypothetical protein [Bacteroidales bacterium]